MSEQEIREGMLLAVWDEPPLDFDPDTLMRRVEQKKSRRRALVAVGVATAMIAVASLALPGLLPRDRDTQLGSESPTSSSPTPVAKSEKELQRIGDQLAQGLSHTMPNLKEQVYSVVRRGPYVHQPNTPTPVNQPGDPEFSGFVFLTDEIGPTSLQVIVTRNRSAERFLCDGATTCRDVQQKDGSTVTEAETFEGPEVTKSVVLRKLPSGLYAQITSLNYNPATGSGLRQMVPVRVGVLTTLVTDPNVHWE
ncbi:hypothetical protein [Lentzea sp. NPDC051838]|uniref:hypothetical protein n=1 Tax=Lentzea sp. NPDC051838 TaxID=3154849 RepID=UPI003432005F